MPAVANVSVTATFNAEGLPGARPHEGRARSRILALFDLNDGVGYRLHLEDGDDRRASLSALLIACHLRFQGAGVEADGWLARCVRLLSFVEEGPEHGSHLHVEIPALLAVDPVAAAASARRMQHLGACYGDESLVALGMYYEGRALVKLARVREGPGMLDESMLLPRSRVGRAANRIVSPRLPPQSGANRTAAEPRSRPQPSGANAGAILQRHLWTRRHQLDDVADDNQLSGSNGLIWTPGHGLQSGRPQVESCRGHREGAGRRCAGVTHWNSDARPGAMLGPRVHLASTVPQSLFDGVRAGGSSAPPSRSMYLGRVPVGTSRAGSGTGAACAPRLAASDRSRGCHHGHLQRAADRIRPRGRPVPVAVDGRHAPMRRSGVPEPTSVPDYRAADYGRIVHSTSPVTARLMTAVVPSLWIAPGRELTGSWALVPRGPTTPEESGNWRRSWPSMSLSA
jgi:hypothetical protein